MACDTDGSGCKVCPGVWLGGLLILVMMLQSVFFRAPTPINASSANSANENQQTKGPSGTSK